MICAYEPCTNTQGPGPLCPSCEGKVYRDLTQLADHWDDLEQALPAGGGSGEKVSGTKERGLPINQQVAAVRHEISHAISYYAQVIIQATTTLVAPNLSDTPQVARWIARHHHHITRHTDTQQAAGIRADTQDLLRQAQNALDADTLHKIRVGPCTHPTCTGTLWARYRDRQQHSPDITCDQNPHHNWEPHQYRSLARQIRQKETA